MIHISVATRLATVALAAVLAGCAASSSDASAEASETTAATAPVDMELSPAEISSVEGISVGREDAPGVIYEFADFQCPGCAQFAMVVTPFIKERYVDTGRARYVYYDYPITSIHPHAFLAARAGRCANEQEKFWEYHDLLYLKQSQWSPLEDVMEPLLQYADEVGMDQDSFEACLESDRYAEEVTASMHLGEYLGVPGTPTLFINGKRVEIRTLEDLERVLEQELGPAPAAM